MTYGDAGVCRMCGRMYAMAVFSYRDAPASKKVFVVDDDDGMSGNHDVTSQIKEAIQG